MVAGTQITSQTQFTLVGLTNQLWRYIVTGDNVLAVEIHQVSTNGDWPSADVVFGLSVTTAVPPPLPLTIFNQPRA